MDGMRRKRGDKSLQNCVKGRDHLGDLGVDGMTRLKLRFFLSKNARTSIRLLSVVTENFRDYPQSVQTNV
jgi:hypothetical protein